MFEAGCIMGIVLASGSPRRRELLDMAGFGDFRVILPENEERIPPGASPEEAVCAIALQKAEYAARSCSAHDIIIAADTLVYLDDRPLGKPDGPDEAAEMLRELSGRKHVVYTGVVLYSGNKHITCAEMTNVYFRDISAEEISAYVDTGEPMDKAGAYGAQGLGAVFIERIEGEFFNVMGLPLCRLSIMLKDFGGVR